MSKFKQLVQKQKERKADKKQRFNLEAKTNANRVMAECPCGSKQLYKDCCQPIHQDIYQAKQPEQLMRSRYSAYVLGLIDYLMLSHHSSTRPEHEKQEILDWTNTVNWLKLEVVSTQKVSETEGFVEFKAHFLEGIRKKVIHEKSRFIKENEYWTYIEGSSYSI